VCLALDIGGTKLAVGFVDARGGIIDRDQVPTPRDLDGVGLFSAVGELLARALSRSNEMGLRVVSCGVGTGGPMEPRGATISPLNIAVWRDFPLRRRLEALAGLSSLPIFIDNDAKALALAEAWAGDARGVTDFVAMVVSTGIGGGIVLDGRLLDGRSGNAGHIGHLVVEPAGRSCRCGARGCLEAETSGSAIEEITGRPAAEAPPEIVERAGRLVGRAVAWTASLLDLRLALVGGSVALGFGQAFLHAAQGELDARACIAHAKGCVIKAVGLGRDGPLVGAAAVGWRGIGRLVPVAEPTFGEGA
jgi:glucokinase